MNALSRNMPMTLETRFVLASRQIAEMPRRRCPVHAELGALIQKTVGVAAVLRRALGPVAGDIRVAFLFGSFA
jgi:hypothetical protein